MIFEITPVTSARPTDCGATCLKMLLSYYGQDVDLETLIRDCHTGITGCSAKNIIEAGRKHGLDLKAWQCGPQDILDSDRPEIIWWMYNHWVLFGGVDDDGKVVIYNPDRGRYRVSRATFASFYTGVSLSNGDPRDGEGE